MAKERQATQERRILTRVGGSARKFVLEGIHVEGTRVSCTFYPGWKPHTWRGEEYWRARKKEVQYALTNSDKGGHFFIVDGDAAYDFVETLSGKITSVNYRTNTYINGFGSSIAIPFSDFQRLKRPRALEETTIRTYSPVKSKTKSKKK